MLERQEIFCHECQKYVQFDVDLSLDGNYILECPNCGHEHCRVVENGRITIKRWASTNLNTYPIQTSTVTTSVGSIWSSYTSNLTATDIRDINKFYLDSWMNRTGGFYDNKA